MPGRSRITRRQVLAGGAAAGVLVAFGGDKALARGLPRLPRLASNPFTLGVASGDPLPNGVVLWTRLAPDPLTADGGLAGAGNLEVGWEVARDESFRQVVKRGRAVAPADMAHSVHVDVRGLEPGREYRYRFTAGDWATPVARTRTAPAPNGALDRMTFAYSTCQKWEEGFYNAYAHMAEEDLDLVVFLGDYTYEYGIDPATGGVRGVQLPAGYADETVTLDRFRMRHALITGDWHSTFVNDVHPDFRDPASPVVATEILAPAVTSNGDGPVYGPYYGPMIQFNPHIKFFEGDRKGYVRCAVDRHLLQADLRYVERVGMHRAPIETFASFVVEDGHPGALPA